MKKWYYKIGGKRKGPFNETQMKEFLKFGDIKADTLVWTDKLRKPKEVSQTEIAFVDYPDPGIPIEKESAGLSKKLGCLTIVLFFLVPLLGNFLLFPGIVTGVSGLICGILALVFMIKRKSSGKFGAVLGIAMSVLGIVVLFKISSFDKPREASMRIACINNLRLIGLALKNYAIDYNGYFPPYDGAKGLEILRSKKYLSAPGTFICPSAGLNPAAYGRPLTEDNVSYIYNGGLKDLPENENVPLAWDKDGNHNGCGNILYTDGQVETVKDIKWNDKLKSDKRADK